MCVMEKFKVFGISHSQNFGGIELIKSTAKLPAIRGVKTSEILADSFFPQLFLDGERKNGVTLTALVTGDDVLLLQTAQRQWNAIKNTLPFRTQGGKAPSPFRELPLDLQGGSPIELMRRLASQNLIIVKPVRELNIYLEKLMRLMNITLN